MKLLFFILTVFIASRNVDAKESPSYFIKGYFLNRDYSRNELLENASNRVYLYGPMGLVEQVQKENLDIRNWKKLETGQSINVPFLPPLEEQKLILFINPDWRDLTKIQNRDHIKLEIKEADTLSNILESIIQTDFEKIALDKRERFIQIVLPKGTQNSDIFPKGTIVQLVIGKKLPENLFATLETKAFDLKFKSGASTKELVLFPQWSIQNEADIKSSRAILYKGESCQEELASKETSGQTHTSFEIKEAGKTYSFRVLLRNSKGKEILSECSNPVAVDEGYEAFKAVLTDEEVEEQKKRQEEFTYIGDRFFVEFESGYVLETGQDQRADYNTNYTSSRLTVHGKPFAFSDATRSNKYLGNLLVSVWYEIGKINFTNSETDETVVLTPTSTGLGFYEYLFHDQPFQDFKFGPHLSIENYKMESADPDIFRSRSFNVVRLGVVGEFDFPKYLSNLAVEFHHSVNFSYNEDPELEGTIGDAKIYDFSLRLLRKYSRRIDIGAGYDFTYISVPASDEQEVFSKINKFSAFLMWHYE